MEHLLLLTLHLRLSCSYCSGAKRSLLYEKRAQECRTFRSMSTFSEFEPINRIKKEEKSWIFFISSIYIDGKSKSKSGALIDNENRWIHLYHHPALVKIWLRMWWTAERTKGTGMSDRENEKKGLSLSKTEITIFYSYRCYNYNIIIIDDTMR